MPVEESRRGASARYEEIAADIAGRIVAREYREGERISGRSTLAATYHVSPETIRRAVALLHQRGIVQVTAGSGIHVVSRSLAGDYVDSMQTRSFLEQTQADLTALLARRREQDDELAMLMQRVGALLGRLSATANYLDEVQLTANAWVVGQTLTSARIRNVTGCTVVALIREEHEEFSPAADRRLQAGDVLLLAGSEAARLRARRVLLAATAPTESP